MRELQALVSLKSQQGVLERGQADLVISQFYPDPELQTLQSGETVQHARKAVLAGPVMAVGLVSLVNKKLTA